MKRTTTIAILLMVALIGLTPGLADELENKAGIDMKSDFIIYDDLENWLETLSGNASLDSKELAIEKLSDNRTRLLSRQQNILSALKKALARHPGLNSADELSKRLSESVLPPFTEFTPQELETGPRIARKLRGRDKKPYSFVKKNLRPILSLALDPHAPERARAVELLFTHFQGVPSILERTRGLSPEHRRLAEAVPELLRSSDQRLRSAALNYIDNDVWRLHCPKLLQEVLALSKPGASPYALEIARALRSISWKTHNYALPPEFEIENRWQTISQANAEEFQLAGRLLYVKREASSQTFSQIESRLATRLESLDESPNDLARLTGFLTRLRLARSPQDEGAFRRPAQAMLSSKSDLEIQAGCHALARLEEWTAIPDIAPHMTNPSVDVQYAAIHAIEHLIRFKPGASELQPLLLNYTELQPFVTRKSRRRDAVKAIRKWMKGNLD